MSKSEYQRTEFDATQRRGSEHRGSPGKGNQALPLPGARAGKRKTRNDISDCESRPRIVVNDRPLRCVAADAVAAVVAANGQPTTFIRGGALVQVVIDEQRRTSIELLNRGHARARLTEAADFVTRTTDRSGGSIETQVHPPDNIVTHLLTSPPLELPALEGIVSGPILRPSGSILSVRGYDPETKLFCGLLDGFCFPEIPRRPTKAQLAAALKVIREFICDFPFAEEHSYANFVGLLLTAVVRHAIRDVAPLAFITAPDRGTGKTLLAKVVATVAMGAGAGLMTPPSNEDEWAKAITSALLEGSPLIVIDNVVGALESANLGAAITTDVWKCRLLGQNKMAVLPNRATWIATGNGATFEGDMSRRVYLISLDARTSRPFERSQFKHPNLIAWILENRARLIAALLTMARTWFTAGCPVPKLNPLGGFERWCGMIGGMLEVSGIEGFLGNREDVMERASQDNEPVIQFLNQLEMQFGTTEFTVAEVVDAGFILEQVLPGKMLREGRQTSVSHAIGKGFSGWAGKRFTSDGLRIERTGGKRHSATVWRIARGDS